MIVNLLILLKSVFVVMCLDKESVDMLSPLQELAEACGYASCREVNNDVLNIHLVPHSHGELGYTSTFHSHYTGYDDIYPKTVVNMKRILDYTIAELWLKPHRIFTFADMPYLFHWWANRDETVRRMVYQLIREGRLFLVGGGWSMSDEATTSYHAIIDHFSYSLRKINSTFLTCGRPLVAWQAEALGHSREFASLVAMMGFDGLFINPISYDDELARMRRRGMEFVWRGSDDLGAESDIYTHKLFDGYWSPPGFCFGGQCKDPLLVDSSDTFANIKERLEKFVDSMKYRQAPYYNTRHLLVMMGERLGYYDAATWFENIDKLILAANSRHPGIKVMYSTPACYLKAVYESNPRLQTKQDDFFPYAYDKDSYATGMYSSRPSLKLMARDVLRFLQIAKQVQVTARLSENNKVFEEYNWINGVLQDHNIITGQSRPHVLSYYITRTLKATERVVDKVLQPGLNKLRNELFQTDLINCRFNVSRCRCTDGEHMFIVIYNPLAWPVSMPVRLPMFEREQLVYGPKGNKIRAALMKVPEMVLTLPERDSNYTHELVFIAEDLPPLGYRSYYFQRYQLGWDRPARSLIKKIKKSKSKKYLVGQNDPFADDKLFENLDIMTEYEMFDEYTTKKVDTKIVFGSIPPNNNMTTDYDIVTPKTRFEADSNTDSDTTTIKYLYDLTTTTDSPKTTTVMNDNDNEVQETTAVYKDHASATETSYKPVTTEHDETTTTDEASTTAKLVITTEKSTVKQKAVFRSNNLTNTFKNVNVKLNKKEQEESDRYWAGYACHATNHPYIRNRYIRVNIDGDRRIANVSLVNGIRLQFDISMFYYVADDPEKMGRAKRPPGAYLFRTMDDKQEYIYEPRVFQTFVFKNDVVQEIHCKFTEWASIALRLYKHSPLLEVDWLVGPIPAADGYGKEVMLRYATNLKNDGVFYTDSNGRQTVKRIRNMRPTFEPVNKDPIAGNLYPVTSKIHIVDEKKNVRLAILTDRAQAATSLKDGEIDLLIHRRLFTEDSGIQAVLNETWKGEGTIVRGQHYIYISKADRKPYRIFEKKLAKEIELRPQILVSPKEGYGNDTRKIWFGSKNEFSALKTKLPLGVHLLTFEQWNDNTILLRLENYLEKSDVVHTGLKTVILKDLFSILTIKDVKETTLAANIWLKEWVPLKWNKDNFLKSHNEAYGTGSYEFAEDKEKVLKEVTVDEPIELEPQQIRTFVVWYEYNLMA